MPHLSPVLTESTVSPCGQRVRASWRQVIVRATLRPVTTEDALSAGTRVRVRRDPTYGPGPWPAEPLGTITDAFEPHAVGVSTTAGNEWTYMILFDEPQRDVDGDGPYRASQVLARYLEIVS